MSDTCTAIFGFSVLYLALEMVGYWIYRSSGWNKAFPYFFWLPILSALFWNAIFDNQSTVCFGAQTANGIFMCANLFILAAGTIGKKDHEQEYSEYLEKKLDELTPTWDELRKARRSDTTAPRRSEPSKKKILSMQSPTGIPRISTTIAMMISSIMKRPKTITMSMAGRDSVSTVW